MNRLESLTAEKSCERRSRTESLTTCAGKGEPIDLRENPFEDPDLRTAHRLLRNAGFAPAWIEERKDIDAELAARAKRSYPGPGHCLVREGKAPSEAEWAKKRERVSRAGGGTPTTNPGFTISRRRLPSFTGKHIDVEKILESIKRQEN